MKKKEYLNNLGEIPERLAPTSETLKTLYIKSGNKCAFPNCNNPLYKNESLISQVCHIEDAKPGGRFNPDKSNEENRKEENLIIMCYEHHVETNNVAKYPVDKLQEMKSVHEEQVLKSQKTDEKDINLIDALIHEHKKTQAQLSRLMDGTISAEELEEKLIEFKRFFQEELVKSDKEISAPSKSEFIETTIEHKQSRINMTIESGQTFLGDHGKLAIGKYEGLKLGIIGFDLLGFTVRNSKYNPNIRNKIINAIGKLFSSTLSTSYRYRSLGDTYILFVPVKNETDLEDVAKKIHIVLNSYDWGEFNGELMLSTISSYIIMDSNENIVEYLRLIFKSLLAQKADGIVFAKADIEIESAEELFTLVSYKKLKN